MVYCWSGYVHSSENQPDRAEDVLLHRVASQHRSYNLTRFSSPSQLDFAGPGLYPPMVFPQPAPAPFSHQSMGNNLNLSTGSSIPVFASHPLLSKEALVFPVPQSEHIFHPPSNTPEVFHLALTSPMSSTSPISLDHRKHHSMLPAQICQGCFS